MACLASIWISVFELNSKKVSNPYIDKPKDKKNNALKFLDDLGNPYDYLAKDTEGKKSVTFGIYGIPESILIDKNFIILKKFIGPLNDNDFNEIKKITNSLWN